MFSCNLLFTQVIKYVQDRKICDVVHIIYILSISCAHYKVNKVNKPQDRIDLVNWE